MSDLDLVGQELAELERGVRQRDSRGERGRAVAVALEKLGAALEGVLVERALLLAIRMQLGTDERDLDAELGYLLKVSGVLVALLHVVDFGLRQRDEAQLGRQRAYEFDLSLQLGLLALQW